jgi:hypothetical protein
VPSDRIFPTTRVLAAAIVPFLVVAVYALYLRTGDTRQLWAWEIRSPMSALMLASAYAAGAYYFTRVAFARRWHHVARGLVPVAAFAGLMAIVTIVHWSQFRHDNVAFLLWAGLYFVTPWLVLLVFLHNRREDPGTGEVRVPVGLRRGAGAAGAIGLAAIAVLFLVPRLLIDGWAWPLTPLTARVLCVIFALFDVYLLCLALDPRWSAARLNVESLGVAAVFIAIGIWRTRHTFLWGRPAAWLFVAAIVAVLAGSAWFVAIGSGLLGPSPRQPAPRPAAESTVDIVR